MIDRPLISLLLTILPIIAIIGVEYSSKRFHIEREITRKLVHIMLGIVAVLGFIEGPIWLFAVIVSVMTLFIVISFFKKILPSVHNVNRPTYGEIFLPIGILAPLLLVSHNPKIYITSILVVTLADSGAGLVGHWQKKNRKTIIGSVVFFIIALIVISALNNISPHLAMLVALVSTVIERFSPYGSDNLTVPLGVAGLMLLLHM